MPGKYNFTIHQGATFSVSISWTDDKGQAIDLTGYKARLQIRYGAYDGNLAIELTTENGGIYFSGGKVVLSIPADKTAQIKPESCVYDLEMVKGDIVTRLIEGKVKISPEVTKDG